MPYFRRTKITLRELLQTDVRRQRREFRTYMHEKQFKVADKTAQRLDAGKP